MNPHDHNVRINPGSNSWLIARTDRDAADGGSAIASLGAVLSRWLNQAGPAGLRGVFQTLHTSSSGGRFVIGAARPVLATIWRDRPPPPDGLIIAGKHEDSPFPRRVRALRPWYLSVTFDWHGPRVQLPWPVHFAAPLGSACHSDMDLDWLLLEEHAARPK